jgi:hypothetical protein
VYTTRSITSRSQFWNKFQRYQKTWRALGKLRSKVGRMCTQLWATP